MQVGPPLTVYHEPVNTFVATFIGYPRMNLLPAARVGIDAPAGTLIGIRPRDVIVGRGPLEAVVDVVETRGPDAVLHLRLGDAEAPSLLAVVEGTPAAPGCKVRLHWDPNRLIVFAPGGQRRAQS